MGWIDTAQYRDRRAGYYECHNELPGSINYGAFPDCLRK